MSLYEVAEVTLVHDEFTVGAVLFSEAYQPVTPTLSFALKNSFTFVLEMLSTPPLINTEFAVGAVVSDTTRLIVSDTEPEIRSAASRNHTCTVFVWVPTVDSAERV